MFALSPSRHIKLWVDRKGFGVIYVAKLTLCHPRQLSEVDLGSSSYRKYKLYWIPAGVYPDPPSAGWRRRRRAGMTLRGAELRGIGGSFSTRGLARRILCEPSPRPKGWGIRGGFPEMCRLRRHIRFIRGFRDNFQVNNAKIKTRRRSDAYSRYWLRLPFQCAERSLKMPPQIAQAGIIQLRDIREPAALQKLARSRIGGVSSEQIVAMYFQRYS